MSRQASHTSREKILAAALRIFGDKGYREATVREIARTAGVATGGLYPYFGSKEQLYCEALLEEMKRYNERIRGFSQGDPRVGIRRYIENHFEFMASKKEMVARHFKDYDLAFAKPIRRQFFAYQKEFLEDVIRKGAERGIFSVAECGDAASFVLCLLKGSLFYDLAGMIDLTGMGDALCGLTLSLLEKGETTGALRPAHAGRNAVKRRGRI